MAEEIGAVTAVVRPILLGTLLSLERDIVDNLGGHERITLEMLARVYRAGDGVCGICFEYAAHDAIRRRDALVLDRIDEVLSKFRRIKGDEPESNLFGAEKTGSQQLIETAKELLTTESVLLSGTRGRPVLLKKHIDSAAREFRKKGKEGVLPQSISGLWKADLFLGKSDADRWVGTTVKVNPAALEGAKGLRVGIVPANIPKDGPKLEDQRNLIVCPLHYDGQFVEILPRVGRGEAVPRCRRQDAAACRATALRRSWCRRQPRSAAEVPRLEGDRGLGPIAQPELLETQEKKVSVILSGTSTSVATGALVVPRPRRTDSFQASAFRL